MSSYHQNWPHVASERIGGYTRTRTGKRFFVLDPRPEEVCVEDIAFSLGNAPRWGGHSDHYPVAQHTVQCARAAIDLRLPNVNPFKMLHHDDSEGYMADMPRPIKAGLPDYRRVEGVLMPVIATAIGFAWPLTPEEHELDSAMMVAESRFLFPNTTYEDFPEGPSLPIRIPCYRWSPVRAREEFLELHYELRRAQ